MKKFLKELKRRKVYTSAVAYIVVAWVLLQVAAILFPVFEAPPWAMKALTYLLLAGFPFALTLSWFFDFTSKGIIKDPGSSSELSSNAEQALLLSESLNKTDERTSIAILPFINMSGDSENEYFSDGLAEELMNVLTQNSELRVASRTSCFAYKGKEIDIPTIGEKLAVDYVLEGSVRKALNNVRITAQLIEVSSDSHLWSENYDRELDDIFAIQSDIAEKIGNSLKVSLNTHTLEDATTTDARAYDFYLKGKAFIQLFDPERAKQALIKAVAIDQKFVRAWADLAQSHARIVIYHKGGETELRAAEEASLKALSLAPNRADVQAARGITLAASGNYSEASLAYEKAIKLDPNYYEAFYNYARTCMHQGNLAKAAELFEKAASADPSNFESLLIVDGVFEQLGDKQKASQARQEGLKRAKKYLLSYPNNQRAYYLGACSLAKSGDITLAKEWAARSLEIDPNDLITRYNLGCFYSQIGELDTAMDMLESSMSAENLWSRSWVANDPDLEPLKDIPRFKLFLEQMDPQS